MEKISQFKVFYRDYVNGVSISSASPEALGGDRIPALAEALLQHADNFLGIVDVNDQVLQVYLDDDEQNVFIELLYPEGQGALRLKLPWIDALQVLTGLPEAFAESLLPGAQFIS